ncbi:hypothetical protein ACZ91_26160, partial [Streptomyces regensis]
MAVLLAMRDIGEPMKGQVSDHPRPAMGCSRSLIAQSWPVKVAARTARAGGRALDSQRVEGLFASGRPTAAAPFRGPAAVDVNASMFTRLRTCRISQSAGRAHLRSLVPPRFPLHLIGHPAVEQPELADGLLHDDAPGEAQRDRVIIRSGGMRGSALVRRRNPRSCAQAVPRGPLGGPVCEQHAAGEAGD